MASKRLRELLPPMAQALHARSSIGKGRQARIDIVSPNLCDATLRRLGPSLGQHIGCTVIDINPGTALWSSKLHDVLKPRSHILVEPQRERYLPWLQPLLDAPSSNYHLREWDDRFSWMPETYINDGLLSKDFGTDTTGGRNHSLLIVANVAQDPPKHRITAESLNFKMRAKLLMNSFRFKTGFQAHGLVRVLMWTSDQEKQSLLPRSVCRRKTLAIQTEMICHAEEVVGGGESEHRSREAIREELINIQSGSRVAQKMKRNNIQIPPERQDETQKRVRDYLLNKDVLVEDVCSNENPQENLINKYRGWHKELQQLEEDFQTGKLRKFVDGLAGIPAGSITRKSRQGSERLTPEWNRLVELQRNSRHEQKIHSKEDDLFEKQAMIDALELEASNPELDVLQRAKKLKLFSQHNDKFKLQLEQMTKKARETFTFHRDDRKAYSQTPPLLMWDRRSCEPLMAQPEEFFPTKGLALLDIQGHTSDLYPMTPEQITQSDFIMSQLFAYPSVTPCALSSISPGAFDAIVPKVPALQDPKKGGRRDLEMLYARCFTPEMLHGMFLAWDQWAFKPSVADLLTRTTYEKDSRKVMHH